MIDGKKDMMLAALPLAHTQEHIMSTPISNVQELGRSTNK